MTCVIGLKRNGHVWIGADTAGISDDGWGGITSIKTAKVWRCDPFIFGGSGSYRAIQLVHRTLEIEKILTTHQDDGPITERFMVCDLVPAIKKIFDKEGFTHKENEMSLQGGDFLIGVRDKLFYLQGDFAVTEIGGPFATTGSGEYVARGAMEVLIQNTRLKPEEIITRSLLAVQKHINSVGAPGEVLSTVRG